MILKGRLKLIYDMLPRCGTLSDIGTDHALIPAYAILNGLCSRAIACDINSGPLERAYRTITQYGLESKMELRLGNGLEPVRSDEADGIVIAGMGGILITELLQDSMEKACKASYILLQPMVGQEVIRPFLWRNGFEVIDEGLAQEGEKLYQAMLIKHTGRVRDSRDCVYEIIGEKLIEKRDPLLSLWLRDRIKKQKKIVSGLSKSAIEQNSLDFEKELLNKLVDLLSQIG